MFSLYCRALLSLYVVVHWQKVFAVNAESRLFCFNESARQTARVFPYPNRDKLTFYWTADIPYTVDPITPGRHR